MPKYWGKQIFSLGSFPEVGQKQKTEKERPKVGNNNGKLLIANTTSGGARKAPRANFLFWVAGLMLWHSPSSVLFPYTFSYRTVAIMP